ncbi:hypothetical protein BT93_B3217 [Corymbia citriodora subsp. variegata]|nr:hypothetical protein BT93_B3217 [Corymbia citriodora subsp. variegata]
MKNTKHKHLSSNMEDTCTSCIPLDLALLILSYKMMQSMVGRISLPQFPEQEAF